MNPLVCLPLNYWLSWITGIVVVVAAVVGIPTAIFGARHGSRLAIELCAKQQGCVMRVTEEQKQTTQNLQSQLEALHAQNPELFSRMNKAMKRALNDTGEHPAIPERPRVKKPSGE